MSPKDTFEDSNQVERHDLWHISSPGATRVELKPIQKLPFIEHIARHKEDLVWTKQINKQTNRQTDRPSNPCPQGKKRGVKEEEKKGPVTDHRTLVLHSAVITPGCRSACQRRSPLSSRSTGPSINGCARCAASISNGTNAERQRRKSSITTVFVFYFVLPSFLLSELTFVAALTCLHRPASTQHFLLSLVLIYQRRDGISGFDLPPLISATHLRDTLSGEELRAHTERGRE